MKRTMIVAVALLATQFVSKVQGEDKAWYLGFDYGHTQISHSNFRADSFTLAPGYFDKSDKGFKLNLGYKFDKNWALEFAYVDLGEFKHTAVASEMFGIGWSGSEDFFTPVASDAGLLVEGMFDPFGTSFPAPSSSKTEIDGYNLALVGIYPATETVNLVAKLGVFAYDYSVSVNNQAQQLGLSSSDAFFSAFGLALDSSESGMATSIELDVVYRWNDKLELIVGYTRYNDVESEDPNMFAIGLDYYF